MGPPNHQGYSEKAPKRYEMTQDMAQLAQILPILSILCLNFCLCDLALTLDACTRSTGHAHPALSRAVFVKLQLHYKMDHILAEL